MGLGFKEADFTFLGPHSLWTSYHGMLGTQAQKSRRGKEKYGSLNLYMIHKGIGFSKHAYSWVLH